jgi:ubiquitin C-terminal hydrolase
MPPARKALRPFKLSMLLGSKALGSNLEISRFSPRDGRVLRIGQRENLTFSELTAFLLTLPRKFEADDLAATTQRSGCISVSRIYCTSCLKPARDKLQDYSLNRGRRNEADKLIKKQSVPTFCVHVVKGQNGARPTFQVVYKRYCKHISSLWRVNGTPNARNMHECTIDCASGVRISNKKARLRDVRLLWPFGRFLIEEGLIETMDKDWFLHSCLPDTTRRRWDRLEEHTTSLKEFLDNIPGYRVIRLDPGDTQTKITYPYNGEEKDIVAITWIAPWAQEAWNSAQYIQLDCSFKLSHPFVYCAPQTIIYNAGIPIGFILTPSECDKTYEWFLEDRRRADAHFQWKEPHIILSDEGSGLKKFCSEELGWPHFFCHRHLIEKFCANSYLGKLVAQLLDILDEEEFKKIRPRFVEAARSFGRKGKAQKAQVKAFIRFISPEPFPHGQWIRIPLGVARCDQHAEGFHGVAKKAIVEVRALVLRTMKLYICICEKYESYPTTARNQLWDTVNALIAENRYIGPSCPYSTCAPYREMMKNRYGTLSFPCRHTAKHWKVFNRADIPDMPAILSHDIPSRCEIFEYPKFEIQVSGKKFKKYRIPVDDRAKEEKENPPDPETKPSDRTEIPEYSYARQIVMAVKNFAKENKRVPDVVISSYWILRDWKKKFEEMERRNLTEQQKERWISDYTVDWCIWAASGDLSKEPEKLAEVPEGPEELSDCLSEDEGDTFDEQTAAETQQDPEKKETRTIDYPPRLPSRDCHENAKRPPPLRRDDLSCFSNATLQCLFQVAPLRSFFTTKLGDLLPNDTVGILRSYRDLQLAFFEEFDPLIWPYLHSFRDDLPTQYRGRVSQDPHEFIMYLFDILSKNLKNLLPRSDETIITKLFSFKTHWETTCQICNRTWRDGAKPMSMLTLELPEQPEEPENTGQLQPLVTLYTLLEQSLLQRQPRQQDCPHCRLQGSNTNTQMVVSDWPRFLVIHLMRYKNNLTKITTHVIFPEKLTIDPRMLSVDSREVQYTLKGMITHLGTKIKDGHYIAYVQNEQGWWKCDDKAIVPILSFTDFQDKLAYLLFYERVDDGLEDPLQGDRASEAETDFLA